MKKSMVCLLVAGLLLMMALTGCGREKVEIKLLPEDAKLDFAAGIVVEPEKPPYNLGGWQGDSEPLWEVEIPETGIYTITLEYSRPGQIDKAKGTVILQRLEHDTIYLDFTVRPTGKNDNDWSVYQTCEVGGANLKAGSWNLGVKPVLAAIGYTGTEHFINLRSVTLKLQEE